MRAPGYLLQRSSCLYRDHKRIKVTGRERKDPGTRFLQESCVVCHHGDQGSFCSIPLAAHQRPSIFFLGSFDITVFPYVRHLHLSRKHTQLLQCSSHEAKRGALVLKSCRGGSQSGRSVWRCFCKQVSLGGTSTEGVVISRDIGCFLLWV